MCLRWLPLVKEIYERRKGGESGGCQNTPSVVAFNGATLATAVTSHSQLTATIRSSMIPAPGNFNVRVKTPAGTTGNLRCCSGGASSGQVLTVN